MPPSRPEEPIVALILGGTTTVARALAQYLLDPKENRAKFVRLVDRFSVKPPTTYIDKDFLALLDAPETKLEYKQVNLRTVDRHVEVLTPPAEWNGKETGWVKFDALFDLTGEVGFDKPELQQVQDTFNMALNLAKSGVKMPKETHPKSIVRLHFPFYDMKDTPHPEGDKLKPEGTRGRWWNETLRGIGAIGGNFGVVRCGAFYGPGTWDWEVMPRLVIGHVYKYLNEEMKFLHNGALSMYTVHIDDVAQALYLTSLWLMATDRKEQLKVAGTDVPFSFAAPTSRFSVGALKKSPSFSDMWETVEGVVPESTTVTIPMFNVIDENNSTQQSLAAAVAGVWGIKYGFVGSTVTSLVERFAKADFNDMIDDVNEKHLEAWSQMMEKADPPIMPGSLSPYLDAHAFRKYAICLDGSRAKKVLGYKPAKPRVEVAELRSMVEGLQKDHIWPDV